MANKTELIRHKMAATRESLRQRLDALEDRTLGVVKETTDAVVQVAETVEGTVESATKAVQKTVRKSVRMFDLGRHADRHPWAVMGGAVAAGFVTSWLLSRATRRDYTDRISDLRSYRPYQPELRPEPAPAAPATATATASSSQAQSGAGMLGGIMQALAPGLDTLKHMAIGTAVGVLKDMAVQAVPPQFSAELGQVFDNLTEKLGGTPVQDTSFVSELFGTGGQSGAATSGPWHERSRMPDEPSRASTGEPQQQQKPGKKKPHGNGRHPEAV